MCQYCKRRVCPQSCPSYNEESAELGRPVTTCAACKRRIYKGDRIFRLYTHLYCGECTKRILALKASLRPAVPKTDDLL